MKKIITMLIALAMVSVLAVSLVGCGAPEDPGAEISVYLGDQVFDFDPTDYYVDSNADQVMSLLYEPLFKLDEDGDLEYGVAKKYKIDEEQRQIVIELRDTYWSDEISVKAADYIYAWRDVILEPNNPNPAAALFYDIENAVAVKSGQASLYSFGAVASDIYEITITYREGADCDRLLKNLASVATSPLREDVVSSAKTHWSKSITTIVTNGPFKIESIDESKGEFTLARNLGYHQKPAVEDYDDNVIPASLKSVFSIEGSPVELTYADIENKTVFCMSEATLEDRAANKSKATVYDDLSTYTYVFNTTNPLFAIKEVRQALSLVLDRETIANAVSFGTAANGLLSNPVAGSIYGDNISNRIEITAKKAEAEQLLSSVDFTGISKSFTLTVNNDEVSLAIAELAKAAWESIGFNVTVNAVSTVKNSVIDTMSNEPITVVDSAIQNLVKEASYGNYNFDVIAVDWQFYTDDAFVALSAFSSHMNGNGVDFKTGVSRKCIAGWWSSAYDNLINEAFLAKTAEAKAAALKAAEALLLDACPVIPVLYGQTFVFISGELSEVVADGLGNLVFTEAELKNYHDYLDEE